MNNLKNKVEVEISKIIILLSNAKTSVCETRLSCAGDALYYITSHTTISFQLCTNEFILNFNATRFLAYRMPF